MIKSFASIIPARKTSKLIKNKNLIIIKNKSLIEYTFKEVVKSKFIKKNYLLTDCKKIISNNHGFYIMPKSRSIDLNDHEEVKIIKGLI